MSRTSSSLKNAAFTVGGAIITMLLQFVNRRLFVNYLTNDYLGLNGLFSNILSMLSLSELGVGAAIIFALYKPVAENDKEKVKSLMSMYKRFYTLIGCTIIGMGIALSPFLGVFIKEMPDIPYIRVYYIMYVLDTGLSYFYTYKRSLIICNRENYISSITTTVTSVGTKAVQLLVLIFTHDYFLFLLTQIVFNRVENIVISRIADRKYPYLLEKNVKPLCKEETFHIRKNIFAMLTHKIGNVIVNGTDNLIISKILGLSVLGLYSNYNLPISAVNSIIAKVFQSITSNIGNLVVEKKRNETETVFFNIFFVNYWIYGVCSICFLCLLQPFVSLWLGEEYLLPNIGRQDLLREAVCRLVYHSQCVVGGTLDKDVTLGEIDLATYRKCLEWVEHRAMQMRSKRLQRTASRSVCDNRTLCHLQPLGNICYCIVTHRDKVEIGLCQAGVTPLALCQLGNLAASLLVACKELHKLQTFGLCHSLSQRLRHISTTYYYNFHIEFIFIAKNFSPMRVKHHLSAPPSEQR